MVFVLMQLNNVIVLYNVVNKLTKDLDVLGSRRYPRNLSSPWKLPGICIKQNRP